jgi:DNA recombination protein RmuC
MRRLALSVQTETGELESAADAARNAAEPLFSGPAPALWAGAGAFLLIFIVGMMLIIRGRVTTARRKPETGETRTYFEPAGEDAEIIFEDAPPPSAKTRGGKAAERIEEAEVFVHHSEETVPGEQDASHAPKKKKGAFAGLFSSKPKPSREPEPEIEEAPEFQGDYHNEFFPLEPDAEAEPAPESLQPEPRRAPPVPRSVAVGAERIAHAEEAAREALQRAEDAEALARDLKRANEEAKHAMTLGLRKQEAALDERAAALDAMERRLAAMADEFESRNESAPEAEHPVEPDNALAFLDAPGVSEDHFAEFADLMGERFEALQGAVNGAIERLSKRLDRLPSAAPGAPAATAARVQLSDLLADALPPQRYKLSHRLASGRTADAAITLPGVSALIGVDARFPVEAFDAWREAHAAPSRLPAAETELRRAVLRHVADAAEKLIAPGETADCAMMFVPSEHMLSELHAQFSDVVQESYRAKVWMVAPTSLMATLHTISAILSGAGLREKDESHKLREELSALRARIAALEARRENGAWREEKPPAPPDERPHHPAATPFSPAEYGNLFDAERDPPAETAFVEDADKPPFPLR